MKPRYSKQILPVPWPSLYRGSTGELAVMLGVVRGNPLNDSPAGTGTELCIPVDVVFLREILLQKCKSDVQ